MYLCVLKLYVHKTVRCYQPKVAKPNLVVCRSVVCVLRHKNQDEQCYFIALPNTHCRNCTFVSASSIGCGAVLLQKVENIWKPLSIVSYSFLPIQQSYATFDCELRAFYLAVCHFRYFVEVRKFAIFADRAFIYRVLFIHLLTALFATLASTFRLQCSIYQ